MLSVYCSLSALNCTFVQIIGKVNSLDCHVKWSGNELLAVCKTKKLVVLMSLNAKLQYY